MRKFSYILIFVACFIGGIIFSQTDTQFFAQDALDSAWLLPKTIQGANNARHMNSIIGQLTACSDTESEKQLLSCVDQKLQKNAITYGAHVTLTAAATFVDSHPTLLSHSHDLAHTVGLYAIRFPYRRSFPIELTTNRDTFSKEENKLIDRMGRTLVDCTTWGVMGCMHGVIEAGVAALPKDRRTEVVRRACMENPLIGSNQVYRNHCLHWTGHGMAIFTDQTLTETLAVCESLDANFASENVQLCISGVFHSGTFPRDFSGEYHQYLSRVYKQDDVYYPCGDIPERFRRQCYNAVPGRSREHDLTTIFHNCHAIPEADPTKKEAYVKACYDAAANILSMRIGVDAGDVIRACRTYANPDFLPYCYAGAVRYWFLRDTSITNRGPSDICRRVEDNAKSVCYTALGAAIYESFYSETRRKQYCEHMTAEYTDACITGREY